MYKILSEDLIQFRQKYSAKRRIHSMQSQSIPQLAFQKIDKFILNSIWTIRGPRVAKKKKKVLENKTKFGRLKVTHFKAYYKDTVIKTV